MARWFLVALFVACLLCVIQAFPQGAPEAVTAEPKASEKIEAALNDALSSLQKGINGLMNDPSINKFVQDGQKFLATTAENIKNQAANIMPMATETPK